MLKKSISLGKLRNKTFILIVIVFAVILYSCSKKTTSPDEQLSAPSNLQITLVGDNKIKLTWNDNSTNETKFFIDRKEGVFDWFENYGEVEANITTFPDEIPTNSDTVYSYRVRAFDGEDYSDYSDIVAWFSVNSAPTNLQLEQIAQDSIKLTWQDNSIGELNFRVDRKIGTQNWQENYKLLEPDTTIYIDYNSSLYDTCYYKVFATSGNSISNSVVSYICIFLAPTNLQVKADGNNILLTWDDATIFLEEGGFSIERKHNSGEYEILGTVPNNEFIDNNVIINTTYFYRIRGFIQDKFSEYTDEISFGIYNFSVPEDFPSIQSAIDNVFDGSSILVSEGTYFENINFQGKNITVESVAGKESTIIDGGYAGSVVTFENGENENAILNGFTIQNGTANYGGGILCENNSSPNLKNLIITNNFANEQYSSQGGGICCWNSSPTLVNTSIIGNTANYGGGGIFCNSNSSLSLVNVTVIGNVTNTERNGIRCVNNSNLSLVNVTISENTGGICCTTGSIVSLLNCILWNNSPQEIHIEDVASVNATYSAIKDGWTGIGNINEDPLFIEPENDNFHLQSGSPCIDAGNPDPQYNDPDGTRNDMGAYGGPGGDW